MRTVRCSGRPGGGRVSCIPACTGQEGVCILAYIGQVGVYRSMHWAGGVYPSMQWGRRCVSQPRGVSAQRVSAWGCLPG